MLRGKCDSHCHLFGYWLWFVLWLRLWLRLQRLCPSSARRGVSPAQPAVDRILVGEDYLIYLGACLSCPCCRGVVVRQPLRNHMFRQPSLASAGTK